MYGGPQPGPYHSSETNGQGGSPSQSQYAQGGQTGQSNHAGQAGYTGQYAQYGPNQSGQHRPRVDERFFVWVRSSAITRGDDRWIGGVCSGLARRLGWSPTLVRALVLASVLLFGFGAALYAIGWMLMPDDRDGRILAEELIAGRWDWSCAGAFACLALAICIPGAGWLAIALAVLALWILAQGGIRQQEGYGFAHHGPAPQTGAPGTSAPSAAAASGMGAPSGAAGTASQFTPPAAQGTAYAASGSPSTMGYGPAEPATRPMPAQSNHYEPPVQSDSPAQPQGGAAYRNQPQTAPRPAAAAYAPAQATYAVPLSVSPRPVKPRVARRKPAGPIVVLASLGLILISAALLVGGFLGPVGVDGLEQLVRYGTIWSGAVCALLGVVIVALGLIGRRTGGLHPFVWIAAFLAFCMVCLSAAYSYVYDDLRLLWARDGYEVVNLGDDVYGFDSSERQMQTLNDGVVFRGMDYDRSIANIDLTDWEERYGTHDLTTQRLDGESQTVESGCPAGQLNISATKAQVQVTIPDGCTWAWGESGDSFIHGFSALGGKYAAMTDSGMGASIGFSSGGYWVDSYGSEYQWLRDDDEIVNGVDLYINVENVTEAQVRVVYESDSTLASAASTSALTKEN
ncbi:phage shock protein C, PspC [Bifidobacterium eulemuris]|nr:phage shock protein C, PspC [Bifidobacterium eulemuris]